MNENNERYFDLEVVLTISSGRIFTNLNNVLDILDYLTNDQIYLHQIPSVMKVAQSHILGRYPELNGVGKDVTINSKQDVKAFVGEQKRIYGDSLAISPMTEYQHMDPIEEAIEMCSNRKR